MMESIIKALSELATIFFSLKMDKEGKWIVEKARELDKNQRNRQASISIIKEIDRKLVGMGSLTDIPPNVFENQPSGTEHKLHELVNQIGHEIQKVG